MNLKFSEEDLKFKKEVKDFIDKNLDKNTQKKNRSWPTFT